MRPPPRRHVGMKKIELVEALSKYFEFDRERQEWLRRRLKHYPEYKQLDDVILYAWVHGLVGREGVKAYVVKSGDEVYELDYGVTRISDGGRIIDDEDGIPLLEALATSDIELEKGDIIVIREYCFRDDRDYKDNFYYIKAEEIISKVQMMRKQIEEEQL
jgi:hypothetical protein